MELCPCGSGAAFTECCGAVIAGTPAATPEALMRARYTAFLRGEIGFLEDTMAPEKKDEFDRVEVEESAKDAKGQGFEVRAVDGDNVEYVARFKMRGQPYVHHERALFRQEDGRWLYVDGEINPKQPPRQVDKVGRNDPCPCGSGQKYKKCCGA